MDLSHIFEIRNDLEVKSEKFRDTTIYYVDNFYKRPREVVQWLYQQPADYWKWGEEGSKNGIHFDDFRHIIEIKELIPVYDYVVKLRGGCKWNIPEFLSNMTLFYKDGYNNYKDNYWYPHLDHGFTTIIYLNENDCSGTNLYSKIKDFPVRLREHAEPWRSHEYWKREKCLTSVFNRLVSFEGDKIYHGMALDSDRFFDEYRINQVMFHERV